MRLLWSLILCLCSLSMADTAVWLRPPNTPAELTRTLTAAKAAGFTDVLLESFYHGRAVWQSGVAPPKLSYDALAVAAPLAKQLGLKLSAWIEVAYWRPAPEFGIPVTPLWNDGYATRSREGKTSLEVSKLGFVDPADPQVGAILERLLRELAARYPDVGLHLDYLRYPREADFGYHPAAVQGFWAQFGQDPRTLRPPTGDPETDDPLLADWTTYRRHVVSALADRLIAAYHEAGGRGLVSAAVYGWRDPLQHWQDWAGLQVAMPMLYLPGNALYGAALFGWPREGVWPGLRVGPGYPPLDSQRATLSRLGYPNVAVFGWTPPATP